MTIASMDGRTTIVGGAAVVAAAKATISAEAAETTTNASKMAMRTRRINSTATKNTATEAAIARNILMVAAKVIASIVKSVNTSQRNRMKVAANINKIGSDMKRKILKGQQ